MPQKMWNKGGKACIFSLTIEKLEIKSCDRNFYNKSVRKSEFVSPGLKFREIFNVNKAETRALKLPKVDFSIPSKINKKEKEKY